MQIHPVIETFKDRYVMDPTLGPVRRREAILDHPGAQAIVIEDQEFYPDSDGTFDVPDDIAAKLLGRKTGNISWHPGANPFVTEAITQVPVAKTKTKVQ